MPPSPHNSIIADSGCTAHFCTLEAHTINQRPTTNPIAIHNPNGSVMYSTHEAELDMPMLPLAARQVHIVPALHPHSLMSIGQLCDNGCTVEFNSNSVNIQHNGTTVMRGSRTTDTRLWHIDTTPVTNDTSYNAIIHSAFGAMHESSPEARVAFMHATLGSPALSTLENAIKKNYLISFPSLTVEALRKHPPRSNNNHSG
jgi:hypothetical protein